MRFSTAWAKTAAQNVTLKIATVLLGIISIFQLSVIAGLAMKDPLVIDRGCYSRTAVTKSGNPTQDEIIGFLNEALPMRFDTNGYIKDGFLAIEETISRERELATLKARQMAQKLIISEFKFDDKDIHIFADRLVSIGKIKSALPLHLKVAIQQSNRTDGNPYGLIVSSVSQIEEKEDKK